MTEKEILQLRDLAEAGQVQFKERITNKEDKYDIGCEMVAFSNSRGGRLVIPSYTSPLLGFGLTPPSST